MQHFVAPLQVPGNLICDLDGVVYRGAQGVEGAGESLALLDEWGVNLIFATNNATRTPDQVAAKIRTTTGYEASPAQVVTSAQAAASLLGTRSLVVFVVGGEGLHRAVTAAGHRVTEDWAEADAVVTGLDVELTYGRIRDAAQSIRAGARFIASNTDSTFPTADGLWPGAGAVVAAIQTTVDIAPEVAGKPYEPMRRMIKRRLGPGAVWVVGDRPETDLALAGGEPWFSVLVLTGVVGDPAGVEPEPDLVVASLPALVRLLERP